MNDEVKTIPITQGMEFWAQDEFGVMQKMINDHGQFNGMFLVIWSYLDEVKHAMRRIFGGN